MPTRRMRRPRLEGRAKKAFDRTLQRVDDLLDLHPVLHGTQGRPRQTVSDVLRGGLVLGLAALDALVVDTLLEAVPLLARRKDGLGAVVAKWVDERPQVAVDCLSSTDPWTALAELGRDQIGRLTFQRSAMIAGILHDVAACDAPWQRAAALLSVGGSAWTEEDVTARLDEYVDRRNRIVHGGDLKKTGSTRTIQLPYVQQALAVIRAVGDAVYQALSQRVASA